MANPMDILRASILTPKAIKEDSRKPEETLETLMSGDDWAQEKLESLMGRPDVSGFRAHQLLKRAARPGFFPPVLKLYIKKFIQKGTRAESLRYMVMTLHLWIHFIGSSDEMKSKDVEKLLPQIRLIIIAFVKHWSVYRNSVVKLFNDIEQSFNEQYNERSRFPGDDRPPFSFSHDNYVARELRKYVFPFIGLTLIELAKKGKYYQTPEDLHALAVRENFGDGDLIGKFYIKSVESIFTLSDISPFIWEPGDVMETFLLAAVGETAKARFRKLCEESPADEVLSLLRYHVSYAEFHFSENKAFRSLTLKEKADFLKPYSSQLETNYSNKQRELLRVWVNDPEWNNPSRSISELTLLALQKRHLFSFNMAWLFTELMEVILLRVYGESIPEAKDRNGSFLRKMAQGESIFNEEYPDDFQKPSLVLAALETIKQRYQECKAGKKEAGYYTDWEYKHAKRQIEVVFIDYLAICLPDYNTDEACEAVLSAGACNNQRVMEGLVQRDLNLQQIFNLLGKIETKNTDTSMVDVLRSKLVAWVKQVQPDKSSLRTAVYLLASHERFLPPDTILGLALDRKNFLDLAVLLTTLQEVIGAGRVQDINFSERIISDTVKEAIRTQIEKRMESVYNTQAEALLFCQHQIFAGNGKNWSWYYGRYPLKSLADLDSLPLKQEDLLRVFSGGKQREHLLSAWKATPFNEISLEFMRDYSLNLHEHPEWANLSLKNRLALFSPDRKGDHKKMLISLEQDFARLWKAGKWTIKRYLKEIERIAPYEPDNFARLALKFSNS